MGCSASKDVSPQDVEQQHGGVPAPDKQGTSTAPAVPAVGPLAGRSFAARVTAERVMAIAASKDDEFGAEGGTSGSDATPTPPDLKAGALQQDATAASSTTGDAAAASSLLRGVGQLAGGPSKRGLTTEQEFAFGGQAARAPALPQAAPTGPAGPGAGLLTRQPDWLAPGWPVASGGAAPGKLPPVSVSNEKPGTLAPLAKRPLGGSAVPALSTGMPSFGEAPAPPATSVEQPAADAVPQLAATESQQHDSSAASSPARHASRSHGSDAADASPEQLGATGSDSTLGDSPPAVPAAVLAMTAPDPAPAHVFSPAAEWVADAVEAPHTIPEPPSPAGGVDGGGMLDGGHDEHGGSDDEVWQHPLPAAKAAGGSHSRSHSGASSKSSESSSEDGWDEQAPDLAVVGTALHPIPSSEPSANKLGGGPAQQPSTGSLHERPGVAPPRGAWADGELDAAGTIMVGGAQDSGSPGGGGAGLGEERWDEGSDDEVFGETPAVIPAGAAWGTAPVAAPHPLSGGSSFKGAGAAVPLPVARVSSGSGGGGAAQPLAAGGGELVMEDLDELEGEEGVGYYEHPRGAGGGGEGDGQEEQEGSGGTAAGIGAARGYAAAGAAVDLAAGLAEFEQMLDEEDAA